MLYIVSHYHPHHIMLPASLRVSRVYNRDETSTLCRSRQPLRTSPLSTTNVFLSPVLFSYLLPPLFFYEAFWPTSCISRSRTVGVCSPCATRWGLAVASVAASGYWSSLYVFMTRLATNIIIFVYVRTVPDRNTSKPTRDCTGRLARFTHTRWCRSAVALAPTGTSRYWQSC